LSSTLKIEGSLNIDEGRLPEKYHAFARSVELMVETASDYYIAASFVTFGLGPESALSRIPIHSMVLRREWLFNIRGTGWVIGVSNFQNSRFEEQQQSRQIRHEMRWGVQMWHECWEENLGSNRTLGIGQSAKWKLEESTFFPGGEDEESAAAPGDGYRELLRRIEMLNELAMGGYCRAPIAKTQASANAATRDCTIYDEGSSDSD